ncbi:MAG: hypothetical protein U5Q44_14900 [Dehalococcoidia bacterium]|nr:hypothetical protein [Dehalococcoidia bacterium]
MGHLRRDSHDGARRRAIKGPPGIHDDAVPDAAELEFVQLGRDLREAAIYLGEGATPGMRRAVLLPSGECLDSDAPAEPGIDAEFGRYIGDPASCVTRAGLVQQLAARTGARMLDRQVAYLSADAPAPSGLVTWFEVLDVVPFSVKALRSRLRAGGWRPARSAGAPSRWNPTSCAACSAGWKGESGSPHLHHRRRTPAGHHRPGRRSICRNCVGR